ncbi:MAG: DNA polymerase III subunit delta [Lachnospiraceae bacterium]|nr:DNA polymerase III subunit delta [Lachnospiraceae bacterium]
MKTIDEDIKSGQFHRIYLLYGDEIYLRNRYRNKLREAIGAGEMNTAAFSGKETNIAGVIDLSETMPFLSEHRLILLEDTRFAKESCEELAAYIPKIPESTVIIMTESAVDGRSKVFKAVKEYGAVVEFERQDEHTLTTWVLSKVKKEGKQITGGAVKLFFERCGDDMVALESELEKLFSYTYGRDSITATDVEAVCIKQMEAKVFDMIADISLGRLQQALEKYYEMLAMKEEPMRILGALSMQLTQMLTIRQLSESGQSEASIAKKMGFGDKKRFIIRKSLEQSRRFTQKQLTGALNELAELEEAVKTGKLQDRLSVELFLIQYGKGEPG